MWNSIRTSIANLAAVSECDQVRQSRIRYGPISGRTEPVAVARGDGEWRRFSCAFGTLDSKEIGYVDVAGWAEGEKGIRAYFRTNTPD